MHEKYAKVIHNCAYVWVCVYVRIGVRGPPRSPSRDNPSFAEPAHPAAPPRKTIIGWCTLALCMHVTRRKGKQRYFQMIVVVRPSFAKVGDHLKRDARNVLCFLHSFVSRPIIKAGTLLPPLFNVSVSYGCITSFLSFFWRGGEGGRNRFIREEIL